MDTDKHGFMAAKERRERKTKTFDTDFTNSHEYKYAEGVKEISPVLTRSGYAGKTSHKINSLSAPVVGTGLESFGKRRKEFVPLCGTKAHRAERAGASESLGLRAR